MSLQVGPVLLREANAFIVAHHRHSKPARGCRFVLGVTDGAGLVGVAVVSRPVARGLQAQGPHLAEVTRCCVRPEAPLGFYAAALRRLFDLREDESTDAPAPPAAPAAPERPVSAAKVARAGPA